MSRLVTLFAEAVNGVKKVNTKLLSRLTVVWLVIAGLSVPAQAGNADETRNLFESAGASSVDAVFGVGAGSLSQSGRQTGCCGNRRSISSRK